MNQLILHQVFWGSLGFLTFMLVFVKLIAVDIFKVLKDRESFFDLMEQKSIENKEEIQNLEKEICYLIESRVKKIENYLDERFVEVNDNWNELLEKESNNIKKDEDYVKFDLAFYKQYSLKESFLNKVGLK